MTCRRWTPAGRFCRQERSNSPVPRRSSTTSLILATLAATEEACVSAGPSLTSLVQYQRKRSSSARTDTSFCPPSFGGRAAILEKPLAMRRIHGSSASSRSVPDPRRSVQWIGMAHAISIRAAEVASGSPRRDGLDAVLSSSTWWQAKANLQYEKAHFDSGLLRLAGLWWKFVAAILTSRVTAKRRAAFLVRECVLLLLPQRLYLSVWWLTHTGRPRLSQCLQCLQFVAPRASARWRRLSTSKR